MKNSNLHICSGLHKHTLQLFLYGKHIAKKAIFFLLLFGFVLPVNLWAQDNTALLDKARDVYTENESLSHPNHLEWKLMGEIPESKIYFNSETIKVENNSVIILFKEEFNEEKKIEIENVDESYNRFVFARLINCEKKEFYEFVRNYYLDNEKLESFSGAVFSNWNNIKPDGFIDLISKNAACI